MTDDYEFESKFWDSIRSNMTAMVGTSRVDPRPMTAQFDSDRKTIYFLTANDTELASPATNWWSPGLIGSAATHLIALIRARANRLSPHCGAPLALADLFMPSKSANDFKVAGYQLD